MTLQFAGIGLDELHARLAAGHAARVAVLTPNARLATAVLHDFDRRQAAAGLAAWETADVLPLDAFLRRTWDDLLHSDAGAGTPLALTPAQEQALWEEAIAASPLAAQLLSTGAAAAQCRQAWALLHAWRLGPGLAAFPGGEDARAFADWSQRYERATRERGFIDAARLPDRLRTAFAAGAVRKPAVAVAFGFDLVTPQQQALFATLQEAGCDVRGARFPPRRATPRREAFETPEEELEAIARWARARVAQAPGARIGIVVPDIAQARPRVARALQRALQPARPLEPASAPASWDFSLGLPLAEWPLAADALALLRLAAGEVDFEVASRIVRSPFIAAGEAEMALRARLDAALRERATAWISLDALLRLAAAGSVPRAPRLLDVLAGLAACRKDALPNARRSAADWARGFSAVLQAAGFPGERSLDSAEFQALAKWHELLAAFASLERLGVRIARGEALSRLERMARETLFQPEGAGGPVQVMGVLESAGLVFDHLWVTGLSDDAWPAAPRPHPLIPVALQRQAGVPQAEPAASLAFDRRITAGWLAAAPEVVVSHARMQDDGEVDVSPLVAHIPEARERDATVPACETWIAAQRGRGRMERLDDARGPELATGTAAGGTSVFKNQSACPFRAFALHRLGSRPLEAPRPGLGANDRGTLLHDLLAAAWGEIGSRARLVALDADGRAELLGRAADAALAAFRRKRPEALSPRFAALERARLVRIGEAWLAMEAGRGDFEVVRIEQQVPLAFGGIEVKARIDRVDRLAAGGLAVLDYKTGREVHLRDWLEDRPADPQLPMYALASGEDVRALAFAHVSATKREFCGLAMEDGLLPRVKSVAGSKSRLVDRFEDWTALTAHWRRAIEALGGEFRAGLASVRPRDGTDTCKQCRQQAFCRVAEKSPQAWDGGEEGEQ